jgi:hypothetical protein
VVRHTICLLGVEARGGRVPIHVLHSLTAALLDAARRSLRLRVEGRSNLQGKIAWLEDATRIDLVSLRTGSTVLEFEAPELGEAVPQIFDQLTLWDLGPRKEQSAISVVEETMREAFAGNAESDFLDRHTLQSISAFGKVLDSGLDAVLLNGSLPKDAVVEVTRPALQVADGMRRDAPPSQRVVVSGELDTLTGSKRAFCLKLSSGQTLRGILPPGEPDIYAPLFTRKVVVDGEAVFRPSGSVSRIIASHIQPATPSDTVWEQIPRPRPRSLEELRPRIPPPAGSNGMDQVFGQWPGDETEEELLAALKKMS